MLHMKPDRLGIDEFQDQTISLCGKSFRADMSGALYWPGERALIVADLHLEKGSAFAARGQMLPPYDTRETLQRLARVIDRYEAETVIALGDSFHDSRGPERMQPEDREMLRTIQQHCEWIWITGNHDPEISREAGGVVVSSLEVEGVTLCHEPDEGRDSHEIAGHLHPAARITMNGFTLRRPCFVGNGRRLVMPAFGAFTGGLNVLAPAFEPLFGLGGLNVWMLGQEGCYPVAARLLCED